MYEDLGVVIVAGGSARRFGGDKLLCELDGMPLFLHSVRAFAPLAAPGCLVVVAPAAGVEHYRELCRRFLPEVEAVFAAGGETRPRSVRSGLDALRLERGFVAVHDAARPLADGPLLEELLAVARRCGGAIPGKPVTDPLKRAGADGAVAGTVEREGLWRVETPQVFDLVRLRQAYSSHPDAETTDDAGMMELAGYSCRMVHNPRENRKITYPGDLSLLKLLIGESGS